MAGRYTQSELNTYGVEDDVEMDAVLDAIERANETSVPHVNSADSKVDQ